MLVVCRKNPTLSGRLVEVRKHFEENRERFLMPLREWYYS